MEFHLMPGEFTAYLVCHISSLLLMNVIFPAHHRALQVKNQVPAGGEICEDT